MKQDSRPLEEYGTQDDVNYYGVILGFGPFGMIELDGLIPSECIPAFVTSVRANGFEYELPSGDKLTAAPTIVALEPMGERGVPGRGLN